MKFSVIVSGQAVGRKATIYQLHGARKNSRVLSALYAKTHQQSQPRRGGFPFRKPNDAQRPTINFSTNTDRNRIRKFINLSMTVSVNMGRSTCDQYHGWSNCRSMQHRAMCGRTAVNRLWHSAHSRQRAVCGEATFSLALWIFRDPKTTSPFILFQQLRAVQGTMHTANWQAIEIAQPSTQTNAAGIEIINAQFYV